MLFSVAQASLVMVLLVGSKSVATANKDSDGHTPPCSGSTPGWVDVDGMGCGWYERNEAPGCPIWGDYTGYDIVTRVKFPDVNRVGVANNNCCHCQGTAVSELRVENSFLLSAWSITRDRIKSSLVCSSGSNCLELALDFRANILSIAVKNSHQPHA